MKEKNLFKKGKRTRVSRVYVALRLLKGTFFIICLTLLFYQSVKFLQVYYKYPTTTKIEFTYPNQFEFPAVTFCSRNPIKRSKFCAEYPDLCESPKNITEACEIDPSACKDNPLDLVIPKLSVLTNYSLKEVYQAIFEIYDSGNVTKEFWEEWAWSIETFYGSGEMKPVFALGSWSNYITCYSENLLLNCTNEPKKINLDSRVESEPQRSYDLNLQRSEEIYFGDKPLVYLSIHSPFVPEDLLNRGNHLKLGHKYNIYIKLAEENLLPFPYETDCTVYEDSWNEGNPQRPRSQEMCKEMCLYSQFERYKNMAREFKNLMEYPRELCIDFECISLSYPEDKKVLERCRRNCKPSCRILKYTSSVEETEPDNPKQEKIQVDIFLRERHVVVERHFALYDTGYLFSYIGGLMGCWLGVSIWAFAGIAESVFRRVLQWVEQKKKYFKETSQASHTVFLTHRRNALNIKIL